MITCCPNLVNLLNLSFSLVEITKMKLLISTELILSVVVYQGYLWPLFCEKFPFRHKPEAVSQDDVTLSLIISKPVDSALESTTAEDQITDFILWQNQGNLYRKKENIKKKKKTVSSKVHSFS